jgi:hypothetical protein
MGWPVLIAVSGGFSAPPALLLWPGAVIAVRRDRVYVGRVDVVAGKPSGGGGPGMARQWLAVGNAVGVA